MRTAEAHDAEFREIAELLIRRYGERSASHAAHQLLKARHRGEQRRVDAWQGIADAVAQLLKADPVWVGQQWVEPAPTMDSALTA